MTSAYTPRFRFTPGGEDHRVRIPVEAFRRRPSGDRSVVVIDDGYYPFVENGEAVTPETLYVHLAGEYDWRRAACGLGCRCDAIMQPRRTGKPAA